MNELSPFNMVNISDISHEIRPARMKLGWSRQTAAAYIGVSEQSICRWESGSTKSIKEQNYDRLMKVLDGTAREEI